MPTDFDELKASLVTGEEGLPLEVAPPDVVRAATSEGGIDLQERKECLYVDLNLFSGSSDMFRQAVGGYYLDKSLIPVGDANPAPPDSSIGWRPFIQEPNGHPFIYSAHSFSEDLGATALGDYTVHDTIVPYSVFFVHCDGDPQHVKNDKHWKTLWTGGEINEKETPAMFGEQVFSNHQFVKQSLYNEMDKHTVRNLNPDQCIRITTNYSKYLPNFQKTTQNIKHESIIPNLYLLNIMKDSDVARDYITYMPRLFDTLSIEGAASINNVSLASDFKNEKNLEEYLQGPYYLNAISASTEDYIVEKSQNLIFNSEGIRKYWHSTYQSSSIFPFGVQINLPNDAPTAYGANGFYKGIINSKFDTRFMIMLKEAFLEQADEEKLSIIEQQYFKQEKYMGAPNSDPDNSVFIETENVNYRTVDYHDFLLYAYDNIKCEQRDFIIVDDINIDSLSAYDTTGSYRHINGITTAKTMDKTNSYLIDDGAFNCKSINSLMNLQNISCEHGFAKCGNDNPHPNMSLNETLAYRIEKKSTPTSGPDRFREQRIQNFWIFNSAELQDSAISNTRGLDFFDSQVIYDKEYEYTVYSYVIVQGVKYKYSGLQLSRIIGDVRNYSAEDDSFVHEEMPHDAWCVEYYDPFSGATAADYFSALEDSSAAEFVYFNGVLFNYGAQEATSHLYNVGYLASLARANNQLSSLATDAQKIAISRASLNNTPSDSINIMPLPPYFAQFLVHVEPQIRIMEIPVYTKKIKVTDNPPNRVNVFPKYAVDNSNKLSFEIHYQNFFQKKYGPPISGADKDMKEAYLSAKDLMEHSEVQAESVSRPSKFEIYRTTERPKSWEDFDGTFLTMIDLAITDTNDFYYSEIFHDVVKSNQKYYYVFRAVNELGIPGDIEEIVIAELIDDGGYKYAIFDVMDESDFNVEKFDKTSQPAKKLLQLSPAQNQIHITEKDTVYQDTAKSQFDTIDFGSAEDRIWGKTFKIRLTSKKTGKKIDLNVFYNKKEENVDYLTEKTTGLGAISSVSHTAIK